jgi:hypothetical protein
VAFFALYQQGFPISIIRARNIIFDTNISTPCLSDNYNLTTENTENTENTELVSDLTLGVLCDPCGLLIITDWK